MEAEQLVSPIGAGVGTAGSSSTTSRAGMCLYGRGPYFFLPFYQFSSKRNEWQLRLATYGPLVEFPLESKG